VIFRDRQERAAADESGGRGAVPLSTPMARAVTRLARLAAVAVAVGLLVLAWTVGIPSNPEGAVLGPGIQRPVQLVLGGVVALATVVSWRWPPVGAAIMALAAASLGVFAAVEYEPGVAIAMTVAVMVPAVLLWLGWQHDRTIGEIAALAVITTGLVAGTWILASSVYNSAFGPTHPASREHALPVDRVEWVWTGGLGPSSIRVVARLDDDVEQAELHVTDGTRTWATPTQQAGAHDIVRFALDDLSPDTAYTFAIAPDGRDDASRGRGSFVTPGTGPTSIRFVSSSCSRTGSNGAVFDALADEDPLLFLELGDIHYQNISVDDADLFYAAYDRFLTPPGPSALYRRVPVVYVWDDHDYGPDNADSTSPTREVAQRIFREAVPSHRLATASGPIYRAFTIGRVRFVITDTRSERTDDSLLGSEQLAWLEHELVEASRTHGLVIWASSTPWIGEPSVGADTWAGYPDERRHIADAPHRGRRHEPAHDRRRRAHGGVRRRDQQRLRDRWQSGLPGVPDRPARPARQRQGRPVLGGHLPGTRPVRGDRHRRRQHRHRRGADGQDLGGRHLVDRAPQLPECRLSSVPRHERAAVRSWVGGLCRG
jgi:hypothetical protein